MKRLFIAAAAAALTCAPAVADDAALEAAGRDAIAEQMAFIRQASDDCPPVPEAWALEVFGLYAAMSPPPVEEAIAAKEEYLKGLRRKLGLKKWCELYFVEMAAAHAIASPGDVK